MLYLKRPERRMKSDWWWTMSSEDCRVHPGFLLGMEGRSWVGCFGLTITLSPPPFGENERVNSVQVSTCPPTLRTDSDLSSSILLSSSHLDMAFLPTTVWQYYKQKQNDIQSCKTGQTELHVKEKGNKWRLWGNQSRATAFTQFTFTPSTESPSPTTVSISSLLAAWERLIL